MEQPRINTFLTPIAIRMLTACATTLLVKIILSFGTAPGVATAVSLGVGIGTYLTSGQRYMVTETALKIRITLRTFTYPFAESSFRLERVEGLKSVIACFRPQGYVLYITVSGKKEQRVSPVLADSDAEALLKLLREKTKVREGGQAPTS